MSELRIRLTGEQAELGSVPARDVARLLTLFELAAARAASVVLGQPKLTTGRFRAAAERAVRFRLRAIESGSIVPVLALPPRAPSEEPTLELDDATLGESAITLLLDAVEQQRTAHPVVAKALLDLADGMSVGDRYDALWFDSGTGNATPRRVRLDSAVRRGLRARVDQAAASETRSDAVAGVVVEADFERHTARLRTQTEAPVQVDFPEEMEEDVVAALRQPATMRGEVTYDALSGAARAISLRSVELGVQQSLGDAVEDFWAERSFDELAREQGAGLPVDLDLLHDAEATEDERDAFIAALADL